MVQRPESLYRGSRRWAVVGRTTMAAYLLAGGVLFAQTPPQQSQPPQQQAPTFRARTDVVPVTVTVIDKNGALVTDLKQSDFTVYENEVQREILSFFPQPFIEQKVPPQAPGALNRAAARSDLAPQTRRVFLFVLGYGRIQYPTRAVDGVLDFVRDKLLPQDVVGMIGFNRATELTTDHEQVARALERYRDQHEKVVFDINEFRARIPEGVPIPPLPKWIQDEIDAIFLSQPLAKDGKPTAPVAGKTEPMRSATEMLLGMTRVQPLNEPAWRQPLTFDEVRISVYRHPRGNIPLTDAVTLGSLLKVSAGIEYLRYVDGQKNLVFLGPNATGGLGGASADIRRSEDNEVLLARRAGDAGVVLNIIHTGGPRTHTSTVQSAQHIAELTGGYFTGLRYADQALATIDQATRFSYLLGYAPVNPELDGKLRTVMVKVNRPNVTVRYQHGYYAAAEIPAVDLEPLLTTSRLSGAAGIAQEASSITVKADAIMLPRMGINAEARVEITIDASQLAFELKDGMRTGEIELQVYAGDAKEKVIGETDRRVNLSADDATFASWQKTGIRQVVRVSVPDKPKYIKVVVYDYGSDRLGSAMITVK